MYKYIFGPVLSRRLGISLGVDMVPYKTCNFNCIYCECGKTTNHTLERKEYVPTQDVINELDGYLKDLPKLDYITFSGAGEPLLHTGLYRVAMFIKRTYPSYKLALITNGSLFSREEVIEEVQAMDLVMPTLNTAVQSTFELIDRPVSSIKIDSIITGLIKLRQRYKGIIYLEVFVVPGFNTTLEELAALKDALDKIRPDKVQLNSVDRPPVETWVEAATKNQLQEVKDYFKEFNVEIIGKASYDLQLEEGVLKERIIELLKRRPQTLEDLETIFSKENLRLCLKELLNQGIVVETKSRSGRSFFRTLDKV